MPVLVPSTYGWKPEGDNWVPRTELEEQKHLLATQLLLTKTAVAHNTQNIQRANLLADEAGALRSERNELLRENATLRRKLEAAERKGKQ